MDTIKYFKFGIILLIAAILYTSASFYSITHKYPVRLAILISIGFAVIEYIFKIYAYSIGNTFLHVTQLQLLWVVLTFLTTIAYQTIKLKQPVHTRTLVIICIIITLITYDNYKKD